MGKKHVQFSGYDMDAINSFFYRVFVFNGNRKDPKRHIKRQVKIVNLSSALVEVKVCSDEELGISQFNHCHVRPSENKIYNYPLFASPEKKAVPVIRIRTFINQKFLEEFTINNDDSHRNDWWLTTLTFPNQYVADCIAAQEQQRQRSMPNKTQDNPTQEDRESSFVNVSQHSEHSSYQGILSTLVNFAIFFYFFPLLSIKLAYFLLVHDKLVSAAEISYSIIASVIKTLVHLFSYIVIDVMPMLFFNYIIPGSISLKNFLTETGCQLGSVLINFYNNKLPILYRDYFIPGGIFLLELLNITINYVISFLTTLARNAFSVLRAFRDLSIVALQILTQVLKTAQAFCNLVVAIFRHTYQVLNTLKDSLLNSLYQACSEIPKLLTNVLTAASQFYMLFRTIPAAIISKVSLLGDYYRFTNNNVIVPAVSNFINNLNQANENIRDTCTTRAELVLSRLDAAASRFVEADLVDLINEEDAELIQEKKIIFDEKESDLYRRIVSIIMRMQGEQGGVKLFNAVDYSEISVLLDQLISDSEQLSVLIDDHIMAQINAIKNVYLTLPDVNNDIYFNGDLNVLNDKKKLAGAIDNDVNVHNFKCTYQEIVAAIKFVKQELSPKIDQDTDSESQCLFNTYESDYSDRLCHHS